MRPLESLPVSSNHSSASCHSAISVVNALATGLGAALGININCKVSASLLAWRNRSASKRFANVVVESDYGDKHNLLETCVKLTVKALGAKTQRDGLIHLSVQSDIPPAVGLKSSSAVSVAAVKAVGELLGGKDSLDNNEILRTSCLASKHSHASLTGAYDDASACLLGGLVLTDNSKFQIMKHSRVPSSLGRIVIIRIPIGKTKLTSSIDRRSTYSEFKRESMKAFEYAMEGEIYLAMMLNSIVQCTALDYPFEPIGDAVNEGATAVGLSGKGPAIAALCRLNKVAERVRSVWLEDKNVRVIKTKIVQPVQ